MRDFSCIIIGAGLFGQIIAKGLRGKGIKPLILDSDEPMAGSKPAACLMKPSWYAGLGKEYYTPALDFLRSYYHVQDVRFKVGIAHTTVQWIKPRTILTGVGVVKEKVTKVLPGVVECESGKVYYADQIIVCAGYWTSKLIPEIKLEGRTGMALLLPEEQLEEPFISPWAPYKQLVGFNRGDGLWVGDGSAIKPENWNVQREEKSLSRCMNSLPSKHFRQPDGKGPKVEKLVGIRPYMSGLKTPCYVEEVEDGVFCVTGGAKNGTIAAGWAAYALLGRLT